MRVHTCVQKLAFLAPCSRTAWPERLVWFTKISTLSVFSRGSHQEAFSHGDLEQALLDNPNDTLAEVLWKNREIIRRNRSRERQTSETQQDTETTASDSSPPPTEPSRTRTVYTEQELKWHIEEVQALNPEPLDWTLVPVYRGIPLALKYIGGQLSSAKVLQDFIFLRQDEDVLHLLPSEFPRSFSEAQLSVGGVDFSVLEVAGNLLCSEKDLNSINIERAASRKVPFQSIMSAVESTLMSPPGLDEDKKFLSFVAYDILEGCGPLPGCQLYNLLENLGFRTPQREIRTCPDSTNLLQELTSLGGRADLSGVIITSSSASEVQPARTEELCYKIPGYEAMATILKLDEWSAGSPCQAVTLEPVHVGGVTLCRAYSFLPRHFIGEKVIVRMSPSERPTIIQTESELRSCSSTEVATFCQAVIPTLGPTSLKHLIDSGLVSTIPDIYQLLPIQLQGVLYSWIDTFAVWKAIQSSKSCNLVKLLEGMSMPPQDGHFKGALVAYFGSLDGLLEASKTGLKSAPKGFKEDEFWTFWGWVNNPATKNVLVSLAMLGVSPHQQQVPLEESKASTENGQPSVNTSEGSSLIGKLFCVTGQKFDGIDRSVLEEFLVGKGAALRGKVSGRIDAVIAGSIGTGPSKMLQAKERGIRIFTIAEFLKEFGISKSELGTWMKD